MQSEQTLMLLVLLAFYAVYFGKMLMQRREGVTTNQSFQYMMSWNSSAVATWQHDFMHR